MLPGRRRRGDAATRHNRSSVVTQSTLSFGVCAPAVVVWDLGDQFTEAVLAEVSSAAVLTERTLESRVVTLHCHHPVIHVLADGATERQCKDASRAAARRGARLARRQLWRRAQRASKVFVTLQRLGLLPPSEANDSAARYEVLFLLDQQLRASYPADASPTAAHVLPYQLRAKAATEPVERYELGRALYHLAQRRGYLSNRKAEEKTDEELDQIRRQLIQQGLTPQQAHDRAWEMVRTRYIFLPPES